MRLYPDQSTLAFLVPVDDTTRHQFQVYASDGAELDGFQCFVPTSVAPFEPPTPPGSPSPGMY